MSKKLTRKTKCYYFSYGFPSYEIVDFEIGEAWNLYCKHLNGRPTRIDFEKFREENKI